MIHVPITGLFYHRLYAKTHLISLLRCTTTALVYQSRATKYYTEWWIIECFALLVTCALSRPCSSVEFGMIGDVLFSFCQRNGRKRDPVSQSGSGFVCSSFFSFVNFLFWLLALLTLEPHRSVHINTLIDSVYQVSQIHKCQHMGLYWHPYYWSWD